VALDVSPGAVDVCQRRGVRRTVIGTLPDLVNADAEPFDTFLLLGSPWMLKRCETAGAGYLAMLQLRD
jgi:hypothetical protein